MRHSISILLFFLLRDAYAILHNMYKIFVIFLLSLQVASKFNVLHNKYQLMSLTKPRDALHPGRRAANKGGRSV